MTKPVFFEGFPCKKCGSFDTVGLTAPSTPHGKETAVTWCSCGVVWISDDTAKGPNMEKQVHDFCPEVRLDKALHCHAARARTLGD